MAITLNGYLKQLSPRRQALVLAGVSLWLGILFYFCFWNQRSGVSVPLFAVVTTATIWLYMRAIKQAWPVTMWFLVLPMVYLATMLAWRSSQILIVINFLTLFGLALLAVWVLRGESLWERLYKFWFIVLLPLSWIKPFFITMGQLLTSSDKSDSTRPTPQIVSGILISVPIVVVLSILFIRTDAILTSLVGNLFDVTIHFETVAIWIVILAVAGWFGAALSFIAQKGEYLNKTVEDHPVIGPIESKILLSAVNIVFGVFLLIQFAYLFGGEAYLANSAVTYAEYARQGFMELTMVSIIAVAVLWLTRPYLAPVAAKGLRALGILLGAQVIVVLFSAMSRLWLYEQAYGFTWGRLLSQTFMIWLFLVIVVLLLQIRGILTAKQVGATILGLAILMVVGLNAINPEMFIAQQNIVRYHQAGKLDVAYLDKLSSDEVPALLPLLQVEDKDFSQTIASMLKVQLTNADYRSIDSRADWRSWNWSRNRATTLLQQHAEDLQLDPNWIPPVMKPDWED